MSNKIPRKYFKEKLISDREHNLEFVFEIKVKESAMDMAALKVQKVWHFLRSDEKAEQSRHFI